MGIRVISFILCLLACLIINPYKIYAGWNGPTALIQGTWGSGANQFGFNQGDSEASFPRDYIVFPDSRIILDDAINGHLLFYDNNGQLIKLIDPEPFINSGLLGLDGGKLLVYDLDEIKKIRYIGMYDVLQEKWLWKDMATAFPSAPSVVLYNGNLIVWDRKTGYQYSLTGQKLKTYSSQPAEMGIIKSARKQPNGSYKISVAYPDITYNITASSNVRIEKFVRDQSANLYARSASAKDDPTTAARINKYNACGKSVGFIDLPADDIVDSADSETTTINAEYSEPVVAPNGDIYMWKRSDNAPNYSILKWTWVDDPKSSDDCSLNSSKSNKGVTKK